MRRLLKLDLSTKFRFRILVEMRSLPKVLLYITAKSLHKVACCDKWYKYHTSPSTESQKAMTQDSKRCPENRTVRGKRMSGSLSPICSTKKAQYNGTSGVRSWDLVSTKTAQCDGNGISRFSQNRDSITHRVHVTKA